MKQRWRLVLFIAFIHLVAQMTAVLASVWLYKPLREYRLAPTPASTAADTILEALAFPLTTWRRDLIATRYGAIAETGWATCLAMLGNSLLWAGCLVLLWEGYRRWRRKPT